MFQKKNLINFALFAACPSGSIITNSSSDVITSPFYPDFYPNNRECTWLINAPHHKVIRIRFKTFDLIAGDYVEVRDGSNNSAVVLKNFTSKQYANMTWTSSGNSLLIKFKSDEQHTSTGFDLAFEFVDIIQGK